MTVRKLTVQLTDSQYDALVAAASTGLHGFLEAIEAGRANPNLFRQVAAGENAL